MAFTRSMLQRIDFGASRGEDVTSPAALARMGVEAYKDANRAIFLQDNRVTDAYKRAVRSLRSPEAGVGANLLGTAADLALPIVKVPTNIAAEAFEYATGAVTGSVEAARALRAGVEKLTPDQADSIMRQLRKGSIGLAMLAYGLASPQSFGGFYRRGRKDEETGPPMSMTIGGQTIPSVFLHHPLFLVGQFGATLRQSGLGDAAVGALEEIPFVREMTEIDKAIDPKTRGRFFGEFAKSLAIPQFIQWFAGLGDDQKRRPTNLTEYIESGIPGLRQNVPVGGGRATGTGYSGVRRPR
jgi:hypothetical protein